MTRVPVLPYTPVPDDEIERALVVTAHPDDVDFGAGGTVARWVDAGIEVVYCVCTDGDAGGFDLDFPRDQIGAVRRAEQTEAAKQLGVHDVRFLGYPDGRLEPTMELRRDISRVIRQVRPQRILVQSPERDFERIGRSHPDHRAAGEAALNSVYPDARNPFAHPQLRLDEGLDAWVTPETWVMAAPRSSHLPAHYVDVTETFDRKVAALRAHQSQTADRDDFEAMLRARLRAEAELAGWPEPRLAESFLVMTTT